MNNIANTTQYSGQEWWSSKKSKSKFPLVFHKGQPAILVWNDMRVSKW